jgi:hypothetical protein
MSGNPQAAVLKLGVSLSTSAKEFLREGGGNSYQLYSKPRSTPAQIHAQMYYTILWPQSRRPAFPAQFLLLHLVVGGPARRGDGMLTMRTLQQMLVLDCIYM